VRTVFMEKGFAAASLDELAAASASTAEPLRAFGDKEQLYIATLRFYGARSVEASRRS
jgi:Bacterial regulatory proteins, tetR family.